MLTVKLVDRPNVLINSFLVLIMFKFTFRHQGLDEAANFCEMVDNPAIISNS
jgi:hypothetical protein